MHVHTSAPTPETSLLLHIASRAASPFDPPAKVNRREYQTLVRYCSDWPGFLDLAHRQKCMASGWRFALDFDLTELIPTPIAHDLKAAYELAQARYLKKTAELAELTAAFHAHTIDLLVIKGIPLAQMIYSDPAVRVSSDIDLLCGEVDLDRASHVLETLGYTRYEGRLTYEDYRRHHYHLVYARGEDKDSVVELHWNIRHPHKGKRIDMGSFWATAESASIDGTAVRAPDRTHALWQLGVNLSYTMFLDLRDLGDLRRLARGLTEDEWTGLIEGSKRYDTENELATALAVSERAFGLFVPDEVRQRLEPPRMIRRNFLPACTPESIVRRRIPFKHTNTLVVQLLLRQGVSRKLEYLFRLVVPTRASEIETRSGRTSPAKFTKRMRWYANGFWMLTKVLGLLIVSPISKHARSLVFEHARHRNS